MMIDVFTSTLGEAEKMLQSTDVLYYMYMASERKIIWSDLVPILSGRK